MGGKLLLGVASTIFSITSVAGLAAQTISIGYGSAGSITTLASGDPLVSAVGPGDLFQATAQDFSAGADLGSTNATISVLGTPGETLSIWVTETDINLGPTPQQLSIVSALTQNTLPDGARLRKQRILTLATQPMGPGRHSLRRHSPQLAPIARPQPWWTP